MDHSVYITEIVGISISVLIFLIGLKVIKKVPLVLHTPLLIASISINSITLIGGIIHLLTISISSYTAILLASVVILISTINSIFSFILFNRLISTLAKVKITCPDDLL